MLHPAHVYRSLPESVKDRIRPILESFPVVRWYYAENSYLREKGWVRSEELGLPVDGDGSPIPWYTYPAIDFLEPRLEQEFRVFEFGSGHSSLWYADRVADVVAVEDDSD